MKKTILATLAIASMMSCSNDEVLDTPAKQAITFDNAFVEKAPGTRAIDGSYTTGSLQAFQVYGTITNTSGVTGRVFTGDVVSRNGNAWTYTCPTQYWVPGNTYDFWAIADGNVDGATSVTATDKFVPTAINLLDASKQKDVLFATRTYPNYQTTDGTVVEFTFHHLMAKAKFTVKNTITTNSGYSYKVSNMAVETEKEAMYNIANGAWVLDETPDTYTLSFGHAVDAEAEEVVEEAADIAYGKQAVSNFDRLLIPSSKQLTVTFVCELYKDGVMIQSQERSVTTAKAVTLEQGKAYNFIISLGNPGEPITFDVSKIEDWDTDHNDDGTDNDESPIN